MCSGIMLERGAILYVCVLYQQYIFCSPLSIPVSIPLGSQKLQYVVHQRAAAMMVNRSGGTSASFINDDGVQAECSHSACNSAHSDSHSLSINAYLSRYMPSVYVRTNEAAAAI